MFRIMATSVRHALYRLSHLVDIRALSHLSIHYFGCLPETTRKTRKTRMKVPQKLYECRDVQSPGVGTRCNIRLQHSTQRVEEIGRLGMQRWSLLREAPELLSTNLERKALHFLHHPNSQISHFLSLMTPSSQPRLLQPPAILPGQPWQHGHGHGCGSGLARRLVMRVSLQIYHRSLQQNNEFHVNFICNIIIYNYYEFIMFLRQLAKATTWAALSSIGSSAAIATSTTHAPSR